MLDPSEQRKEDWNKAQSLFERIDPSVESFANKHSLVVTRNYHSHPERSLEWKTGDTKRILQIYLKDIKGTTFNFWMSAFKDEANFRYSKSQFLVEGISENELVLNIDDLLENGKSIVDNWNESEFKETKL